MQNRFKNEDENKEQSASIAKNLKSNEFDKFYPYLSMKKYSTQLPQRQSITKTSLAKTTWFKNEIEKLLKV